MASQGISGLAVAVATTGALLAYSGFKGSSPLTVLRDLSNGSPSGVSHSGVSASSSDTSSPTFASTSSDSNPLGVQLVNALGKYKNDKYSQAKRTQPGFSDCSSWVGKGLRDVGVKVPGGLPITTFYLVWTGLQTVSKSDIQPGDLLCAAGHMAVAVNATQAVGQQNPTDNVKADTIANIMYGTTWVPRRLKTTVQRTVSI